MSPRLSPLPSLPARGLESGLEGRGEARGGVAACCCCCLCWVCSACWVCSPRVGACAPCARAGASPVPSPVLSPTPAGGESRPVCTGAGCGRGGDACASPASCGVSCGVAWGNAAAAAGCASTSTAGPPGPACGGRWVAAAPGGRVLGWREARGESSCSRAASAAVHASTLLSPPARITRPDGQTDRSAVSSSVAR